MSAAKFLTTQANHNHMQSCNHDSCQNRQNDRRSAQVCYTQPIVCRIKKNKKEPWYQYAPSNRGKEVDSQEVWSQHERCRLDTGAGGKPDTAD